ncbi:MAG: permease [Planctomycetes bacterium]|nr:permease [Planctomycetota bacterium]
MNKKELKILMWLIAGFVAFYFIPLNTERFTSAIYEALALAQDYAREHVLLCLVPAFFIAGGIAAFIKQNAVMKYLGANAKKVVSYSVAAVSGTILAVCSCTVLPLFAGIYTRGAGIGPATAFLYAGPAINVLAIILTARVLGAEIGVARAVGAIVFSIVIGLLMHLFFGKEDKKEEDFVLMEDDKSTPLYQNVLFFAAMIIILVFANWSSKVNTGVWGTIFQAKWYIVSVASIAFAAILIFWMRIKWWKILTLSLAVVGVTTILTILDFETITIPTIAFAVGALGLGVVIMTGKGETREWFDQSWFFTKQMLPLLLFGVLAAGFLLGRPDFEGAIPSEWINQLVGGNSVWSNFFASIAGAFMYFATLTEVPILQGLMSNGMGKGPALALLLAGPALSLPNMLVIRSIMGTKKTAIFVLLVIIMATISGIIFGQLFT